MKKDRKIFGNRIYLIAFQGILNYFSFIYINIEIELNFFYFLIISTSFKKSRIELMKVKKKRERKTGFNIFILSVFRKFLRYL